MSLPKPTSDNPYAQANPYTQGNLPSYMSFGSSNATSVPSQTSTPTPNTATVTSEPVAPVNPTPTSRSFRLKPVGEVRRGKWDNLPNGDIHWNGAYPTNVDQRYPGFLWYDEGEKLVLTHREGIQILDVEEHGSISDMKIPQNHLKGGDAFNDRCVRVGGENGHVVLWDLKSQKKLLDEDGTGKSYDTCCFLEQDQNKIIIADSQHNSTLFVWDLEERFTVQEFEPFQSARIQAVIRDPNNGSCFLAGCSDKKGYMYDIRENTGKPCKTFLGISEYGGFSRGIQKPLCDPYSNSFMGISSEEVIIWDVGTAKKLHYFASKETRTTMSKGYSVQSWDSAAYYSNIAVLHWKGEGMMFYDLNSDCSKPVKEVAHNWNGPRYVTVRNDMVIGQNFHHIWSFTFNK